MQVEILALVYLAKKHSLTSADTIFSLYNLFFPVYLKVIVAVAAAGCSMVFLKTVSLFLILRLIFRAVESVTELYLMLKIVERGRIRTMICMVLFVSC